MWASVQRNDADVVHVLEDYDHVVARLHDVVLTAVSAANHLGAAAHASGTRRKILGAVQRGSRPQRGGARIAGGRPGRNSAVDRIDDERRPHVRSGADLPPIERIDRCVVDRCFG